MARKTLLKGFKKPSGVSFEQLTKTDRYGQFTAYPYERGFGTTVGNTLRRALLSSIQGYAVSAVKFMVKNGNGSSHLVSSEFESLPGVREDIPDIIASLKKLEISMPEDSDGALVQINCKGPGKITGKDFEKDRVTILNGDLPIITMMDDCDLDVEIQVDLGRGYVPSEVNDKYTEEPGVIALDAFYSPVKRVKYSIEPARIGQRNDYEKLILDIYTDGTIKPEDALGEAALIIKEHFSAFINFNEETVSETEEVDEEEERVKALLNTPIEELEFTVRSSNCLKNANIKTIGDLAKKNEDEIKTTRNFGTKSLDEIKAKLKEWGLTLGMTDFTQIRNSIKVPEYKVGKNDES